MNAAKDTSFSQEKSGKKEGVKEEKKEEKIKMCKGLNSTVAEFYFLKAVSLKIRNKKSGPGKIIIEYGERSF